MIHLVTGPACGGKTTFAQKHKGPEDIIVDSDLIAQALGSNSTHDHPGHTKALAARLRDYATLHAPKGVTVWVVSASPSAEANIVHDEVTVMDPGKATCLARAAQRPRWTSEAINEWYSKRDPDIVSKVSNSRSW